MLGVPYLVKSDVVAACDKCGAMFDPGAGGYCHLLQPTAVRTSLSRLALAEALARAHGAHDLPRVREPWILALVV